MVVGVPAGSGWFATVNTELNELILLMYEK